MIRLLMLLVISLGIVGCNTHEDKFLAKGSGEYWKVVISYSISDKTVRQQGKITYLGKHLPSKFRYEYVYPKPNDSNIGQQDQATITVYDKKAKEWSFGSGTLETNESDSASLKKAIGDTFIKFTWEQEGKQMEEKIKINEFESQE